MIKPINPSRDYKNDFRENSELDEQEEGEEEEEEEEIFEEEEEE